MKNQCTSTLSLPRRSTFLKALKLLTKEHMKGTLGWSSSDFSFEAIKCNKNSTAKQERIPSKEQLFRPDFLVRKIFPLRLAFFPLTWNSWTRFEDLLLLHSCKPTPRRELMQTNTSHCKLSRLFWIFIPCFPHSTWEMGKALELALKNPISPVELKSSGLSCSKKEGSLSGKKIYFFSSSINSKTRN